MGLCDPSALLSKENSNVFIKADKKKHEWMTPDWEKKPLFYLMSGRFGFQFQCSSKFSLKVLHKNQKIFY